MVDFATLTRSTLTIRTARQENWLGTFPVIHMAEHLIGRRLGRQPPVAGLTGHVRRGQITIRFTTPDADMDVARTPDLATLDGCGPDDFDIERHVLEIEDQILPEPLRSRGRLPSDLSHLRYQWQAHRPTAHLHREPFLTGQLAGFRPSVSMPSNCAPRRCDCAGGELGERAAAQAALSRRLAGAQPELFLEGGPLRGYYSSVSVLLNGLSAYQSPLVQQLRHGYHPLYSVRLFDFPWRHRRFIACVTQPAIGPARFRSEVGWVIAHFVAEFADDDLRTVLTEGVIGSLDDLSRVLSSPRDLARLQLLARLNGFPADSAAICQSVLGCDITELELQRNSFLRALSDELDAPGAGAR